jgi:hypothetical protein
MQILCILLECRLFTLPYGPKALAPEAEGGKYTYHNEPANPRPSHLFPFRGLPLTGWHGEGYLMHIQKR